MKPISPNEVVLSRPIPDDVIECFNDLISKNWNGSSSTIMQSDIAMYIAGALNIPVSSVYKQHYLDVEPLFRLHGWDVEHDNPGYNETYAASFRFTPKKSEK